jgi:putative endonuclease
VPDPQPDPGIRTGMDRRQTGMLAENSACAFLESQGFTIVTRNFLRRVGELDVVARAGDLLIIVEVRTRASQKFGGAAASIGRPKQRRIAATAALLLQQHRELRHCRVRFDVIIVRDGGIEWFKHAFSA